MEPQRIAVVSRGYKVGGNEPDEKTPDGLTPTEI